MLELSYGSESVDLALVTKVTDSFQKSVSVVPVVSRSADFAFPLETGSGEELTISFERVNPVTPDDDSDDTDDWSNAHWYTSLIEAVDRWQMRTDGFEMDLVPSPDNPYIPERLGLNGYVNSMSLSYKAADNTRIRGSLTFSVGAMYIRNSRMEPVTGPTGTTQDQKGYKVMMTDSKGLSWYHLLSEADDVDCISAYTLKGGLEQPFEILTMSIPKDKLNSVAPELVNDIVAGKNKVSVEAVGVCRSMTVSSVKLSGSRYRVTAYSDAAKITGYNLDNDAQYTADKWILEILASGKYGVSYTEGDTLVFRYAAEPAYDTTEFIEFRKGTNAWRILQIAAMYMGCKVMFAEDRAYVVDLRIEGDQYLSGSPVSDFDAIDLYDRSRSSPMYGKLTGEVAFGDEGEDTIINRVDLTCKTYRDKDETQTYNFSDRASVNMFGERGVTSLNIPELVHNPNDGYRQAEVFAQNYMDYRDEPQQSVSFTLKEVRKTTSGPVWESTFSPLTRVAALLSIPDGFIISNRSVINDEPVPQKLMLSTFTRNYPEGTTTYNFGVITPVDLSGSLGGITQNM